MQFGIAPILGINLQIDLINSEAVGVKSDRKNLPRVTILAGETVAGATCCISIEELLPIPQIAFQYLRSISCNALANTAANYFYCMAPNHRYRRR
jgi:hypothetical protein